MLHAGSVPYGSTWVSLPDDYCDCVLDQLPEDDDGNSDIELKHDWVGTKGDTMIYSGYMPTNQDRGDEWAESAENEPDEWPDEPGDEECADIFEQVEQAPLVKPTGPCVELNNNGVTWRV